MGGLKEIQRNPACAWAGNLRRVSLQFAAAPRAALPKIELPNPTEQEREVVAMVNEDLEQAARHGSAAQADEIAAYVKENRKAETITAATELALHKRGTNRDRRTCGEWRSGERRLQIKVTSEGGIGKAECKTELSRPGSRRCRDAWDTRSSRTVARWRHLSMKCPPLRSRGLSEAGAPFSS